MHGRPEPLAASRPVEQDLDHVCPAKAGNNLMSRGHDAGPGAVNRNLVEKPFGVTYCERLLTFYAYLTAHLWACQEQNRCR